MVQNRATHHIFKTENFESCYNLESAQLTIGTIQPIETFQKFSVPFLPMQRTLRVVSLEIILLKHKKACKVEGREHMAWSKSEHLLKTSICLQFMLISA